MDDKDVIIQDLRADNKKLTEELKQLKKQSAAVDIDKLTTEMMEHICDNICKHPIKVGQTQEQLEDICAECKMGKFVSAILNTYNHTQSAYNVDKVLEQIKELRTYCDKTDCKKCKCKDTCFDAELEKIVKVGGVNE